MLNTYTHTYPGIIALLLMMETKTGDDKSTTTCGLMEWVKVAQFCPTLNDPRDCSPPDPSVHGILQARTLEWVARPFSSADWLRKAFWCVCVVAKHVDTAKDKTEYVHACKTNQTKTKNNPSKSKANEMKNVMLSPVRAQPQREKLFRWIHC